jgi:hypothetical protein
MDLKPLIEGAISLALFKMNVMLIMKVMLINLDMLE